jgi:hypothetical protein
MTSNVAVVALVVSLALAGCASTGPQFAGKQGQHSYALKDGATLVVDADGRMRMFDIYGRPVYMKDGVEMETKDGTVIVMKENVVWRTLRTRGTFNPHS